MSISYKKLCKTLFDKDIKKKDLQITVGICSSSIINLGINENIDTEALSKIYKALACDISNIIENVDVNSTD